jgi:hypothetical protein
MAGMGSPMQIINQSDQLRLGSPDGEGADDKDYFPGMQ